MSIRQHYTGLVHTAWEGSALTDEASGYLLAGSNAEQERLRLQARVWEPAAAELLDRVGVQRGWQCLDLGCGEMGILGPLSRRVGPAGRVVGVDINARSLAAAADYLRAEGLGNVELQERDAFRTGLPADSFDLVHARFEFAPLGRDNELLAELLRLTRPGGVVVIEEPDATPWNCYPPSPAWHRLKAAILAAFSRGGGDFNAGQRIPLLLRSAGLAAVQVRAAVVALSGGHPYMRLPVQFATSLRQRILDGGLLSEAELAADLAECERVAADPDAFALSFIVVQAWGRKPGP